MPLSFQRQQAGEYNVSENGKTVAYIQKFNSSKWITYFCNNPAIKGKPQNVAKTLKDSKAFCETHIGDKCSNPSVLGSPLAVKKTLKELKVEAEALIASGVPVPTEAPQKPLRVKSAKDAGLIRDMRSYDEDKYEMMKEMLDRDYVIDISKYKHVDDGLEEIDLDECDFLTEEELATL